MTHTQMIELLRDACANAGSQVAWATANGVSAAYVSDVLGGRREPGAKILAALGLTRSVCYTRLGNREDAQNEWL